MWAPAAAYLPLGRAGLALILISCSARHFSDTCWSQVLSTTEALEGLVAPAAAYVLLGRAGPVLNLDLDWKELNIFTKTEDTVSAHTSSLYTFHLGLHLL